MPEMDRPAQSYLHRHAALWKAVSKDGIDAILVFGYGDALGAGSQSHGALRYLTGWNSHEAQSLAILTRQGYRLLIGSPFLDASTLEPPFAGQGCAAPPAGWAKILAASLGSVGKIATIGFGEMPNAIHSEITSTLDASQFHPIDNILSGLRMVKDDAECAALRAGAAICDDLFDRLPHQLRQNEPVWKTQLHLETHARLEGAEYCKTWLTVMPKADRPRYWPEENRTSPSEGDQVLFGIALTVDGYWAHGIRMGAIGSIRTEHETLWHIAFDAQCAGNNALRPDMFVNDSERAISGVILSRSSIWPEMQRFRNGHSLGLSYEDPVLSNQFPQHWPPARFRAPCCQPIPVKSGMILELHPNLFVPGVGGAALGDMFHVTPEGTERMLQFPRRLFLV